MRATVAQPQLAGAIRMMRTGPTAVVACEGEVDLALAPLLRFLINEAVAVGAVRILIDLTETRFLDSTIMGVLVGGHKTMSALNGSLELIIGPEQGTVVKMFRITGLTKIFPVHATLDHAVPDALAAGPP